MKENYIRIADKGIVAESIVDGPGLRYSIYAQGCQHNCEGCHNPQTHDFNAGDFATVEQIVEAVQYNPLLDGVTFSGGDPFEQAMEFAILASKLHNETHIKNIMVYTGYTFEEIMLDMQFRPGWRELLDQTDILVDGRFDISKRNLSLKFRGSDNQRIIDVQRTLDNWAIAQKVYLLGEI